MGRKPKPSISKTSQKRLLKNLSVLDFGFGVGFDVDNSYMGDVSRDTFNQSGRIYVIRL